MLSKCFEIKKFENIADCSGKYYDDMWTLYTKIFNVEDEDVRSTKERLSKKRLYKKNKILLLLAYHKKELAGFKLGYEEYIDEVFYSWLGGVDKEYRNMGIGEALMEAQHKWCKSHNYLTIRTETKNIYREMLILNIKNGFNIIETSLNSRGETKIILEKNFND